MYSTTHVLMMLLECFHLYGLFALFPFLTCKIQQTQQNTCTSLYASLFYIVNFYQNVWSLRVHITQTSNNLYEKKFSIGKNPRYGVGRRGGKKAWRKTWGQNHWGTTKFCVFPNNPEKFSACGGPECLGWWSTFPHRKKIKTYCFFFFQIFNF